LAYKACRFITLTLREDGEPIAARLDRLLASFKLLRQGKLWKANAERGFATVEVTPGSTGKGAHVHLHLLVDGEYMPQAALSQEWLRITKDSMIVHITAPPDRAAAAAYLSSYVTKGGGLLAWPLHRIRELATALKGRRMAFCFGKRLMPRECCAVDDPCQIAVDGPNKNRTPGQEKRKAGHAMISLRSLIWQSEIGFEPAREALLLGARRNKAWCLFLLGTVPADFTHQWNAIDEATFIELLGQCGATVDRPDAAEGGRDAV